MSRIPTDTTPSSSSQRPSFFIQAALDIGTTYSGYAFSYRHEYKESPLTIHANDWQNASQGQMHAKTPTCLLLHKDKTLHSFGNMARQAYSEFCLDGTHKQYYFFWNFKMKLHQNRVRLSINDRSVVFMYFY